MLLMIDNYDSFTYNLVQYFGELGEEVHVVRNDEATLSDIRALKPTRICISPGPGAPDESGVSLDVIRELGGQVPILGVCLGMQAMGQIYGGTVVRAKRQMHGKTDGVRHSGQGVFKGLPSPFTAARYHSLVVAPDSVPECLEVTAWADDGEIMGLRHKTLAVEGVQFHPESIATEYGHLLLKNFLNRPPTVNYG